MYNLLQGDPSPCAKPPVDFKSKVPFGLVCPGLARPKRSFTFEVNGRFCTRRRVTLYMQSAAVIVTPLGTDKAKVSLQPTV